MVLHHRPAAACLKNVGRFLISSLWISSLTATPIPARPQEPQTGARPLQYDVSVVLKLVQVYVTARNGDPVLDLAKEDFVLLDDGKPVKITEFERHDLRLPAQQVTTTPEEESKPAAGEKKLNRRFFLFFDFAYNNGRGIEKAKQAALHFIDTQIQPTDEVGILSYSLIRRLVLHEYLTTNHRKIRKWIETTSRSTASLGAAINTEEDYWKQFDPFLPQDVSVSGGTPIVRSLEQSVHSVETYNYREDMYQAYHLVDALTDLGKSLAYIPGRKNIIFFSSGIPGSLIYGIQTPFAGRQQNTPLQENYDKAVKMIAASNSAFYVLDTQRPDRMLLYDVKTTGQYPLQRLSKESGGEYFGNVDNYKKALITVQNRTSCYYVLGYYVGEKSDGRYQTLEVKVKRAGCRVSAPKGYFNPKPFKELTDFERMLHLVDLAVTENPVFQIPLRFPASSLPYASEGKTQLALFSRVPLADMRASMGTKLEIIDVVFDKDDHIAGFRRVEADLSKIPEADGAFHHALMPVKPGSYKCRTVIRDLETGRGAVGSSSAAVPEYPSSGILIYPPLLLRPETGGVFLNGIPSMYPFDSERFAPLLGELPKETGVLHAIIHCVVPGMPKPDIKLFFSLDHQTSRERWPLECSPADEYGAGETRILVYAIHLNGLKPGRYALRITAEEETMRSSAQTHAFFEVH